MGTGEMNAIELMVSEHENIRVLIRVMRQACLEILEGKEIQTEDFRRMISLIRNYADQNHHGKEEDLLFNRMQEYLGNAAQTLVRNGMLVEHDLGRLYVRQLEEAVSAYEENQGSEQKLDVLSNAMAYTDLLSRHIERENAAVYPFAKRGLPKEVLEEINRQTAQFEKTHTKERECQLAALEELKAKYPRKE